MGKRSAKNDILAAWSEGLLIPEIMSRVSRSRATVYSILKDAGIDISYARGCLKSEMPVLPVLNPLWAAEFRGFFYGDGCASLNLSPGKTKKHFQPMLKIGLRADDVVVLKDIHVKLGGNLIDRDYTNQPSACAGANPAKLWYVVGWGHCRAVIEATGLASGHLPAKKTRDVALLYETILIRYQMPHLLGPKNREILMGYRAQLQEIKRFRL